MQEWCTGKTGARLCRTVLRGLILQQGAKQLSTCHAEGQMGHGAGGLLHLSACRLLQAGS